MEDRCRIMIVDDEFIMRQGIRYMMNWEEEGYVVAGEASNGKEALERLEDLKPHIILCDIAMPIMDGIDFIRIVKSRYPDMQIVVLSSYDKFDFVRQALLYGAADYVLKPTLNPEELLRIVRRTAQKIPNLQLVKKEFSCLETQLEQYLESGKGEFKEHEFLQTLPHSCFRLMAIPLVNRDTQGSNMAAMIYEKAENFLKDTENLCTMKFLHRQEVLCIVLNYDVKDTERILERMRVMMEQLSVLSPRIAAAAGKQRGRLAELREDFQSGGFLEAEIFYHRDSPLYLTEENESRQLGEKFNIRRFTSCVTEHSYEEALEIYRQYIEKAAEAQMPEFKLKNQTKNLLYNLIGSCQEHLAELEDIRREYFQKIDQVPYCEEFLQVFYDMLNKITELLGDREKNGDRYLKEMLQYIREHYREDLDLKNLAEVFNFNYSYLSAYFNSHVGEGFSEYLNRIRIQKACDFLSREDGSISEVSALVGYSDHSYFCRVFKKITGKTPSRYRREQKRKS